jgi:hypothetical protein
VIIERKKIFYFGNCSLNTKKHAEREEDFVLEKKEN